VRRAVPSERRAEPREDRPEVPSQGHPEVPSEDRSEDLPRPSGGRAAPSAGLPPSADHPVDPSEDREGAAVRPSARPGAPSADPADPEERAGPSEDLPWEAHPSADLPSADLPSEGHPSEARPSADPSGDRPSADPAARRTQRAHPEDPAAPAGAEVRAEPWEAPSADHRTQAVPAVRAVPRAADHRRSPSAPPPRRAGAPLRIRDRTCSGPGSPCCTAGRRSPALSFALALARDSPGQSGTRVRFERHDSHEPDKWSSNAEEFAP
jgi:hypothetical protein